jgi:hypothetical protein
MVWPGARKRRFQFQSGRGRRRGPGSWSIDNPNADGSSRQRHAFAHLPARSADGPSPRDRAGNRRAVHHAGNSRRCLGPATIGCRCRSGRRVFHRRRGAGERSSFEAGRTHRAGAAARFRWGACSSVDAHSGLDPRSGIGPGTGGSNGRRGPGRTTRDQHGTAGQRADSGSARSITESHASIARRARERACQPAGPAGTRVG